MLQTSKYHATESDMAKEMATQILKEGNMDQRDLARTLLDEIAQEKI